MPELTAEAREEIRAFLNEERKILTLFGASAVLSLVAIIGGFLAYAIDDLRTRSELTAQQAIDSLRITHFDPALAELKGQIATGGKSIGIISALLLKSQEDILLLSQRAERALEDLNKAEGSLMFAKEVLDLNSKILELDQKMKSVQGDVLLFRDLGPEGPAVSDLFPGDGDGSTNIEGAQE